MRRARRVSPRASRWALRAFVAGGVVLAATVTARVRAQDPRAAEALLAARGCMACHTLDGTAGIGPTFASAALVPHEVTTSDGQTHEVTLDRAYVRRSILEPDAELVRGYAAGTMPRLAHDDADADAIADAVVSIASGPARAPAPRRSPLWLALAVLAFVLGHFVLSSTRARAALVARLGEARFQGVYSLLVLGAFVWMIAEWVWAPYVELFRPPAWTRWVPNVVMPFAYTLLVAGYTTKSPTVAGMTSAAAAGPTGWTRITRHPALWGFALWGLSHLPPNGDLRSLLLMGGIAALAIGGMLHIDARRRAMGGAAWAAFERATSIVPFAAIARGAAWPSFRELGWWRFAIGLGGWALMLHLHRWAIGVSPLP